MYQIIAPTLFQNKICRLPGIGTLMMVAHAAENDFVNGYIKPPVETISFTAGDPAEKGFNEFSAISELLQKNLDEKGNFLLTGIGTFTKDLAGEIRFDPVMLDPIFTSPVRAERIARQAHAAHSILVGNQETTNIEMKEYYSEKLPLKNYWWIPTAILAAIGITVLLFYYYKYGWNGFGNVSY